MKETIQLTDVVPQFWERLRERDLDLPGAQLIGNTVRLNGGYRAAEFEVSLEAATAVVTGMPIYVRWLTQQLVVAELCSVAGGRSKEVGEITRGQVVELVNNKPLLVNVRLEFVRSLVPDQSGLEFEIKELLARAELPMIKGFESGRGAMYKAHCRDDMHVVDILLITKARQAQTFWDVLRTSGLLDAVWVARIGARGEFFHHMGYRSPRKMMFDLITSESFGLLVVPYWRTYYSNWSLDSAGLTVTDLQYARPVELPGGIIVRSCDWMLDWHLGTEANLAAASQLPGLFSKQLYPEKAQCADAYRVVVDWFRKGSWNRPHRRLASAGDNS